MEIRAIKFDLGPNTLICVILCSIGLSAIFSILIHLNFAFQSIAVSCNYSKIGILDLVAILRTSHCVHKLKFVLIIRIFTVHGDNSIAALIHAFSECDNLFLVFPK